MPGKSKELKYDQGLAKERGWNIENFQWAVDTMLSNPKYLDMKEWGGGYGTNCGTPACFAGTCDWLLNISGEKAAYECLGFTFSKSGSPARNVNANRTTLNARKFLGISHMEAEALFIPSNYPMPFLSRVYKGEAGSLKYAMAVVDRIQHFLLTGR